MDIFSIIFLIIFFFLAILGAYKGFLRTFLFFAKGIIALVIAYLLCNQLADLLIKLPFVESMENGFISWLNQKGTLFSTRIYPGQEDLVVDALKSIAIPEFLAKIIANNSKDMITSEGIILSETISFKIISLIMVTISFIIILIVTRVLLFLLRKIMKHIMESLPAVKSIDRIFGLIFGIFLSIIIIDTICFVLTGLISIPFLETLKNYMTSQMKLGTNKFTISKFFYEHNLLLYILKL